MWGLINGNGKLRRRLMSVIMLAMKTLPKSKRGKKPAFRKAAPRLPDTSPPTAVARSGAVKPDFSERLRILNERKKALGYKPPTKAGWEVIARAIAGE